MNSRDFDRLLDSIRTEDPGPDVTAAAAARVRERLKSAPVIPAAGREPIVRHVIWAIAAVLIAAAGFTLRAPSGPRATVARVDGKLYRISRPMTELVPGSSIGENDEIRTAKDSRAVITLRDGSSIELAERTDLTLSEGWISKTVHLERGAVLVEAARQRRGRLEVSTHDCLVSVKGTIFGVSQGTKGSRVSVIEGEVKVDQDGASHLLHRGDQTATSATMKNTSVAEDISWSHNSAKYVALLGEFAAIQKRIEETPGPGLRYQSKLAGLLPENTMVFASIPNLGPPALAEANKLFEERVGQSAVLREWWNDQESRKLRLMVDRVRAISDYLGDEVMLAVPGVNGKLQDPMLLAEVRRPGLQELLARELGGRKSAAIHGNVVVLSSQPVKLSQGAFLATPFWARIARSYQSGAGWLFAANMEQIAPHNVQNLVIERRQNLGRTESLAALTFAGGRSGVASWLASPGPMGSLDFVSPEASFSASFVVKNPGVLLKEFPVTDFNDAAEALGGEITIAVDGPLLPTPSWKVAVEVDNPTRLQSSIERAAGKDASVQLTNQQVGGLTYYELTSSKTPLAVDYVFIDGYLLLAPNRALLTTAIRNRAAGITLPRSAAFRAQLPQDGHLNFSGLLYYHLGSAVGPIVDQLKATGLLTPEQQQSVSRLTANREPVLIYAYGEPDRIVAASRSGFFGFGLDTLVGLNAKGEGALRQLLPPVFDQKHATRN